jgi:ArsR family transcriptional regulator, arsenate/arsenite/antimonite-responsive transcriptional repressor / arsenate reductase (thioredoxin)
VPAAETAPPVLKLVGHDVRWQLIRRLAEGDLRVNELVDAVDLAQNLVSYHLRLLREGELVVERRSSADGRDVYYHLDLDRLAQGLSDSATSVHASIGGSLPRRVEHRRRSPRRPRVLFICTGNSARSQIAEATLRAELGSDVEIQSAGPSPTEVHPLAIKALEERGIAVEGLRSKGLEELRGIDFDLVITLCDRAKEACYPSEYGTRQVHWSLPDPAAVQGPGAQRWRAFQATADEIAKRVRHLIPVLTYGMEG